MAGATPESYLTNTRMTKAKARLQHSNDSILAELIWLDAIYGVDLDKYAYYPDYPTNLKAIAKSIISGARTLARQ